MNRLVDQPRYESDLNKIFKRAADPSVAKSKRKKAAAGWSASTRPSSSKATLRFEVEVGVQPYKTLLWKGRDVFIR